MTDNGGANSDGTIFSIETDGTGFTILHEFEESVNGKDSEGSLILADGKLYGMTEDSDLLTTDGFIFSINLDGTGFQLLHEFDEAVDGGDPEGTLVFVDGTFYGITHNSDVGDGTIFSFVPSLIPEPSTFALGLLGLLGISFITWRRRRG